MSKGKNLQRNKVGQRSRGETIKQDQPSEKPLHLREDEQRSTGRFLHQPPDPLKPLLTLANLLPVQFRRPVWARPQINLEEWPWYRFYEDELFRSYWHSGRNTDERWSEWQRFLRAIEALPLLLQAFILEDHDGEIIEIEGYRGPSRDFLPPPTDDSFDILNKPQQEVERIVKSACERFEITFDLEKKAEAAINSVNHRDHSREIKIGDRVYGYIYSDTLLRRARQRWIYIIAAQETLVCLTRVDAWKEVLYSRTISSLYEAQSTLYIIPTGKDKGKLGIHESPLYQRLVGIEASRIRMCPVCACIFWVGRSDAQQCGDRKCKSTLSSRLSRNPELRALYNKARRKRRAQKKALPAIKKGK